MIKKLFSFVCCLVPFGAMADVVQLDETGSVVVPTAGFDFSQSSYYIANGNNFNTLNITSGSMTMTGNMRIWGDINGATPTPPENNSLYINNGVGGQTGAFNLISSIGIDVAGALSVDANPNGREFVISSNPGSARINVSFGSIENNGILTFNNIENLNVTDSINGDITNTGTMTVNATGLVDVSGDLNLGAGATTTINAGASVTARGVRNYGTAQISGASIETDNNLVNETGGVLTLNTTGGGAITVGGNLVNRGDMVIVPATGAPRGAITVSGNMTNESPTGNMTITASSLTVNGPDAFVNNGNFKLVVTGTTDFKNGINLAGMPVTNTFDVETGQFLVGGDNLQNLFTNSKNLFRLNLTNGDLNVATADIYNVTAPNAPALANMTLGASGAINVRSIRNAGDTLTITAENITVSGTDYVGAPVAAGVISGAANSTTVINAGNALVASGTDNSGTMTLQAKGITLASLTNNADLTVRGGPDGTGVLTVTNDIVNNNGTMNIDTQALNVSGRLVNAGGDMIITKVSDINLGGMAINGGVVDMTASSVAAEKIDITGGDMIISRDSSQIGGILSVGGNIKAINVNTNASNVGGEVRIGGDVLAAGAVTPSVGDLVVGSDTFSINADKNLMVGGTVNVTGNPTVRTLVLNGVMVNIGQDMLVDNQGRIVVGTGSTSDLTVGGRVSSLAQGVIDMNVSNTTTVGALVGNGKFIARGKTINATMDMENAIDIQSGITMTGADADRGLVILGTDTFELGTSGADATMNVAGGVNVGAGNTLKMTSLNQITLGGTLANAGTLSVTPVRTLDASGADVNNTGTMNLTANTVRIGNINNATGTMNVQGLSGADDSVVVTGNVVNTSGAFVMNGTTMTSNGFQIAAGSAQVGGRTWAINNNMTIAGGVTDLSLTTGVNVGGVIDVAGDVVQRGATGPTGALNILNNMTMTASNMNVHGALRGISGVVGYDIANTLAIDNQIIVNPAATVNVTANTVIAHDIENSGTIDIITQNGMDVGQIAANYGYMGLDSGAAAVNTTGITTTNGRINLKGAALTSSGAVELAGALMQNGGSNNGDVNITATNYIFTAPSINATDIIQYDGAMTINTGNLELTGGIDASDLRIAAQGRVSSMSNNWLTVGVGGNVSGGIKFSGLKNMTIGGSYEFNNNSFLHAAIMPAGSDNPRNYWSTVSLADDNTLGTITNASDGAALVQVGDTFVSNITQLSQNDVPGGPLDTPLVGIDIFKMIDQGTAIWLVHAQNGINESNMGIRNVAVKFCNADGTRCFDYLDLSKPQYNGSSEDLPAYLTTRDTDGDGIADSLYIVFDPRFGGPVAVYQIQPIVNRIPDHTSGESAAAGALDNWVAGRLNETGFYNETPIDAIPIIFKDTNFAQLARELYNRMEYYNSSRDGAGLARFSRLVQPREMEQIVGGIVLNEHTTFRDFEDRMFDEFIWNRNRNLKKAWLDFDYGLFNQRVSDGKRTSGDRFAVSGGFDWQRSNTLIVGLTGRISHMSGDNSDTMDLGYKLNEHFIGHVDVEVADTNIGLGGYLIKTLGTKARVYGNAFADIHLLDVTRHQTYVDEISGDGTAFALTTEWGLMHDILNQYVVGNLYARAGYNFGFSLKEKVGGETYMNMESDGYMMLTPGYSLIAQKRIYPNAWMQLRPYASVGVEYDVLGAPDKAKFKFGSATVYSDYDIELNPLWANVGGGLEFLMANGLQFGADYRYQYNSEIQLHNIRLSGSYRF